MVDIMEEDLVLSLILTKEMEEEDLVTYLHFLHRVTQLLVHYAFHHHKVIQIT